MPSPDFLFSGMSKFFSRDEPPLGEPVTGELMRLVDQAPVPIPDFVDVKSVEIETHVIGRRHGDEA